AARRDTRVEEARDVRMTQTSEQPSLTREALIRARIRRGEAHQLDGGDTFVQTVGTLCEPYLRHAAGADEPLDAPRPELHSGEIPESYRRSEKGPAPRLFICSDQREQP